MQKNGFPKSTGWSAMRKKVSLSKLPALSWKFVGQSFPPDSSSLFWSSLWSILSSPHRLTKFGTRLQVWAGLWASRDNFLRWLEMGRCDKWLLEAGIQCCRISSHRSSSHTLPYLDSNHACQGSFFEPEYVSKIFQALYKDGKFSFKNWKNDEAIIYRGEQSIIRRMFKNAWK